MSDNKRLSHHKTMQDINQEKKPKIDTAKAVKTFIELEKIILNMDIDDFNEKIGS